MGRIAILLKQNSILLIVASLFAGIFAYSDDTGSEQKVAIVIMHGDLDPRGLDKAMSDLENEARETYKKLGFKTIVLGGQEYSRNPPNAITLNKIISGLNGVKDLRVDFIGHGGVMPTDTSIEVRYPDIILSRERRKWMELPLNTFERPAFFAADDSDAASRAHWLNLTGLGERFQGDMLKNSIGVGDMKASLSNFRNNNSNGIATLSFLNCYSGIVGEQLRKEYRTLIQSGAPTTQPALNLNWYDLPFKPDGTLDEVKLAQLKETPKLLGYKNGMTEYYQQLRSGQDRSLFEAWQNAQISFRQKLSQLSLDSGSYNSGRSASTQSILGWCNETDVKQEKRLGTLIISKSSDLEAQPCDGCQTTVDKRLAELSGINKRIIFTASVAELDEIHKKTADAKKKTNYDEAVERQINCLQGRSQEDVNNGRDIAERQKFNDYVLKKALIVADKVLRDPKEDILVRKNVKEETELYLKNAEAVSESRRVTLQAFYKDVLDDVKWPTLKSKLVSNFDRIKDSCKNIVSPVCEKSKFDLEGIMEFVSAKVPWAQVSKCDEKSDRKDQIDCRYSLRAGLGGFLNSNWVIGNQPTPYELCKMDATVTQLILNQHQLENDRSCLARFLKDAPDTEWKNLERIYSMASRSALGSPQTFDTHSTSTLKRKAVK